MQLHPPRATVLPTPESLHARHATRIHRRVRALLGPDADHDDLVQEVFMVVLSKMGSVRDPVCFDAWVNQVTLNVLRAALRQRRLRRRTLSVWFERQTQVCHTNVEARDTALRVIHLVERLPTNERALLVAHWFAPDGADAVAAASGGSVFTARRRLRRALSRFERLVGRDSAFAGYIDEASGSSTRANESQDPAA